MRMGANGFEKTIRSHSHSPLPLLEGHLGYLAYVGFLADEACG
jgi:hypothetical protein